MKKTNRILVVDDEPAVLQVLTAMLHSAGYEVWEASNGRQALQWTRERRPDLVLLDVQLPDLSGTEVCRQIKADAALLDIFVVLISGAAISATDKVGGAEIGADDYLVKPVNQDEFLARIRTMLRLQDTAAALRASEQLFRQLTEHITEVFWMTDPDNTRMIYISPGYEKVWGRTCESLNKSPLTRLEAIHPEDRDRVLQATQTKQAAGEYDEEYRIVRPDGSLRWIRDRAFPVRDETGTVYRIAGIAEDITQRKLAEEKLTQLSRAVEQSPVSIVITDTAGNIEYANPKFVEVTGYTLAEVLGRNPRILKSGEINREGYQELWQTITAGKEWRGEFHNKKKNGELYWESASISPIRDRAGRITHFVAVKEDITGRRRAEAALRRSEMKFRTLYDSSSDAVMLLDKESFFDCNQATLAMFGCATREEFCSKRPGDVSPPVQPDGTDSQVLANQRIATAMEKGSHHFEWMHQRADTGEIFPADVLLNAMELDGKQVIQAVVRDITERKQAEGVLREAEARYRSIFENATEGIFQSTPDGHLVIANPALARMFGYESPEEMISSITDIERQIYVSPEGRRELKRILDTEGSVQGFEAENYRKDGSRICIRLNGRAVRDASGVVLSYQGTIQEDTERKWAENLLQIQRDCGVFLSSTNDLKAALERLLAVALQNSGVDCGAVYLVDPKTGALDLAAQQGLSARFAERASHFSAHLDQGRLLDAGPGISHPHGKPLAGMVRQLKREGLRVMEVIPTQYNGRVVAVMSLGSRSWREIPARSRQAIEAIVTRAGGAIARIRAEQSLRASRQLQEKTLNNLHDAVFLLDARTGIVQECNAAALEIFGYTRDELVGRTPGFLHPMEALLHQLNQDLSARSPEKGFEGEFELKMKRKSGTEFPAEHRLTAIRDEAGRLVSWVNVVRDISERKRVEEELRQLPQRITEAQEAERLRVARELHDGVNQIIASAKMRLLKVQDNVAALSPAAREILSRCGQLLNQALEENRRIAHNLRPSDLDELGLAAACRNLCKEMQSRANLVVKSNIRELSQRLPSHMELNLFRILQEALNNVEKHARAKNVFVQLSGRKDQLVLKIRDDGRGFASTTSRTGKGKRRGIGLTNMRERAVSLGGTCDVESIPRQGTTITVRIPSPQAK